MSLMAAAMVACNDTDVIPDITPGICPDGIELVVPADVKQLIYTDNTGAEVLPLVKGQQVTMGVTLTPANITYNDVIWTSSEPSVATVANGQINAISGAGLGYSVVTVVPVGMYPGAGVSKTLKVKVDDVLIPAENITLTCDAKEVYEGEQITINYTITPEIATYQTLKWTSSDPAVATVDNGIVTGVSVGSAVSKDITVKAEALDGSGKSATFNITVKRIVEPESVTISQDFAAPGYLCSIGEKSVQLDFTPVPAEATLSRIEWVSSNPEIATVDATGLVTFNQTGNFGDFTITATCPATGKSSSVKMSMPAGLVRELYHNENNLQWYNATQSGNGTESSHKWTDGLLTITTYKQNSTKQRADFKCWATPIWLHAGNYPIFAVKMDDLKDLDEIKARNLNFDVVGNSASGTEFKAWGNGNNKWTMRYKCSDGSYVFVYDMTQTAFGTGGMAPTNEWIQFKTFQIKYADIEATSEAVNIQRDYRVFWVQTFKSMADLQSYMTDVDKVTYEVNEGR